MEQWEYKIVAYTHWSGAKLKPEHEEELNALGEEGWELVGMSAVSTTMTLVFKRPIEAKRSTRRRREDWPSW